MKKRILSILAIALAVVAGSAVTAYLVGKRQSENDMRLLEKEIELLHENEKQAAVVRRTSQQMEDIAFQQKALSDSQRDSAEVQRQLAVQMRLRAEQESREARQAKAQALDALEEAQMQRSKAEEMQLIAIDERDRATFSKNVSDTLYYRNLSNTIATSAVNQLAMNGEELSMLIAYSSYYISKKYKGNYYRERIFEALAKYTHPMTAMHMPQHGAVEDIANYPAEPGTIVAVSDYGEIVLCNEKGIRTLFFDKLYDFRWVEAFDDEIFAISFHGPVIQLSNNGKVKKRELPEDNYSKLIHYKRGIMLMGEKRLVWFNPKQSRNQIVTLDRTPSSIVEREGQLLIFFQDGTCATMDNMFNILPYPSPAPGKQVTASCYDSVLGCLCLGYKNGDVEIFNKQDRFIERLLGHRSTVNDIQVRDSVLLSCAYDKTAQIWCLPLLQMASGYSFVEELASPTPLEKRDITGAMTEWVNPVKLKFNTWAYSAGMDKGMAYIGTSGGEIHVIPYDANMMAAQLQKKLKRNMTPEEWKKYVSQDLPYEQFK